MDERASSNLKYSLNRLNVRNVRKCLLGQTIKKEVDWRFVLADAMQTSRGLMLEELIAEYVAKASFVLTRTCSIALLNAQTRAKKRLLYLAAKSAARVTERLNLKQIEVGLIALSGATDLTVKAKTILIIDL